MSCQEVRPLLILGSLSALEEDETSVVSAHVATCEACREESGELGRAVDRLKKPARPPQGPSQASRAAIWEAIKAELDVPAAASAPADAPVELSIALVCTFCRGAIPRREAHYCASCLAPHHGDCWSAHGRCSTLGCEETRTVRPMGDEKPAPVAAPRRRLGRYALGVAVLLTGAGAVAALGLRMKVESAREALKERVAELEEARKRAAVESTNLEDRKKALEEKEAEVSKVGMELGPLISFVGSQANLLPETGGETSGPPAKRDEPIDLNVEEVGLAECMATISSQVGCTIVVAPDVHEKVTVALRHIPWEDAVQVIAKMTKCDVSPIGSDTLLLSQCPKVTIQFTQADVRTVLQLLAAYCGKNIIVAPSVHGDMVTLDLHEVDWLAALRGIVATNNLHAVPMGDAIVILPGPGPDPFAATPRGAEREIPVLDAEPGERNVDVTVEDADLREVCDELGRRVGRNVIVEPDVHEKVTVDLRRIAFSEALRVLGWLTKCRVERRGSIYVLSQPPKVTLQASGTPAHKWFQLLAAYAGENIVVAPEVTGAVTMDLHEVDWMDAIKATALAYGFEVVERDGHLLTVRKKNIDQRPGGVK